MRDRTAIMMYRQIVDTLVNAQGEIRVACHRTPDGDTLGAGLAIFLWLKALGKPVGIYCADPVPGAYSFLPGTAEVSAEADHPPSVLVAVDCASADRMGETAALLIAGAAVVINIDHHITNTLFGSINHVEGAAGSTAELVTEMLLLTGQTVTADIADCLYTGIVTDTGQFAFDYTRPASLRAAAQLMEHGAAFEAICARVFRRRTLSKTRLIALALSDLRLYAQGTVALVCVPQSVLRQTQSTPDECENIVNYTIEIEGVEVGILLRETQTGDWKVSLRSSGDVNVSALAQLFGGGGHRKAAGCTLSGNVDEVQLRVVEAATAAIAGL